MGNITRLIIIWGAAILLYIAVSNATGTATVVRSFKGFTVGTTKVLQGR